MAQDLTSTRFPLMVDRLPSFKTAGTENPFLESRLKEGYHLISAEKAQALTWYYWVHKIGPRQFLMVTHMRISDKEELDYLIQKYREGAILVSLIRASDDPYYISHYWQTEDQRLLGFEE